MSRLNVLLLCILSQWSLACAGAATIPEPATKLNDAGAAALASGDLETAGARLQLALEYHPEFVEALSNLALVEMERGNFQRADQLLHRAIRLNPDLPHPHHGLGLLAERRYSGEDAVMHFRDALKIDPGFVDARAALARVLYHHAEYEAALIQFRRLREIAPQDATGHVGLASVFLSLERFDEARQVIANAWAEFGTLPELQLVEARRRVLRGRFDEARALLKPLAGRRDAYGVTAQSWWAIAELAQAHPHKALEHAHIALGLDPEHPLSTYVAAVCLDDLQHPEARTWLERALALNPAHPELQRRLKKHPL